MQRFELGSNDKDPILRAFAPRGWLDSIPDKRVIPALAKDPNAIVEIERILPRLPTFHHFQLGDSISFTFPPSGSAHLVLTSPPYWTLKRYNETPGQLGHEEDYKGFLAKLGIVWGKCYDCLVPGGRLVVVVGDVCLSRRQNHGRHVVIPLHSAIAEDCTAVGFDYLSPIIWHKIANASYEASGVGIFGKPYEPNGIIKNDIEYILIFRKPGAYRHPTDLERRFSIIDQEQQRRWFRSIWST